MKIKSTKLTKDELIRIALLLIVIFVSYAIFSDWVNFKAGLFGSSPI